MDLQKPRKILVIDDEKDTVDMLTALLELEGYQTISSHSGTEGMKFLESERQKGSESETPVDLTLLDVMLG